MISEKASQKPRLKLELCAFRVPPPFFIGHQLYFAQPVAKCSAGLTFTESSFNHGKKNKEKVNSQT